MQAFLRPGAWRRLPLALAAGLLVVPAARAQDPARARLEQARALAAEGKAEPALAALRAAVFLHRGDVEISREYQIAMVRAGRREEVVKEYRALAEAFPDEATWHYLHGRLLAGEPLEKEFREAIRIQPGFFWAHFGLGQFLIGQNRSAEAVPHLRRALELRPDLLDVHDALAMAHHFAGDYESAEQVWREAVKLFPQSPAPRVGLGVLYKTLGRGDATLYPRAVEQLEAVLKTWPDTWEAYEPLIQTCYAMGQADKAERHRVAARALGRRLKQRAMIVDVIDIGTRALIVTEVLDDDTLWLRAATAPKGREKVETTPAAYVVGKEDGSADLYRADPAKPEQPGAFVEHFAKPPAHAAIVARVRAAVP
jgi:Flp pilus assembly protein TadD